MALDRYWHWRCDLCLLPLELKEYGLPKNWCYFIEKSSAKTLHACDQCCGINKLKNRMVFDINLSKSTTWRNY